ncbi:MULTISPECIES: hypothetical protein [Ramlibacter]|uniref:Uncharacterized protein n=1 Tax=Ramlibacter pinisoli TaxID=2682844 RepID=A0A6N8ISB5_9BURK|nr:MULTISPECIES: hypothetical protein [Ramlibacter]MBA2964779.1 hypothetical protein [Ramlibacter sp. CGMCC 1.13660]MVQ29744.1 hypothetical protein [Ramlibacter pinisoli]
MTSVLPMPAPRAPLPVLAPGSVSVCRGWQRAIDKAQGEAWFRGPLAGHSGFDVASRSAASDAGMPRVHALSTARRNGPAEGIGTPAEGTGIVSPTPAPTCKPPLPATAPGLARPDRTGAGLSSPGTLASKQQATVSTTGVIGPRGVPTEPVPGEEGASPARPRSATGDPAHRSVHVHVEHQPDGLHIWLGAPAGVADLLLRQPGLQAALQRGLPDRLATVVLNGVLLDRGGIKPSRPLHPPGPAGHNQEP